MSWIIIPWGCGNEVCRWIYQNHFFANFDTLTKINMVVDEQEKKENKFHVGFSQHYDNVLVCVCVLNSRLLSLWHMQTALLPYFHPATGTTGKPLRTLKINMMRHHHIIIMLQKPNVKLVFLFSRLSRNLLIFDSVSKLDKKRFW